MNNQKIVNLQQLIQIVGDFPRSRKVVHCHGTFDIVHPGHIRHLQFAKSKAEILVTSITADEHITKGAYRPYVPEQLRANNLASLEVVDFVLIDSDATPIKILESLKPDFFAKGYEYQEGDINPKTQEEIEAISTYGGEMLFTPGDIVYSSSALIGLVEPEIRFDKLLSLMGAEGISFVDLRASVDTISGKKVHIVGDTIVDRQTICTPYGGGTKTPTLSVRYEGQMDFTGGAAIVAKHLKAAGANVHFTTVLGEDEAGKTVVSDLESCGIDVNVVTEPNRPTTIKNAIIAQSYRLLKIDIVENTPVLSQTTSTIQDFLSKTESDAVIFSDFRHGIFNQNSISTMQQHIPGNCFTAADSQVASRWGNILDFQGFDLITPNEKEARFSLGDQDTVVRPLAKKLHEKARCKTLILKCGDKGVITYVKNDDDYRAFFSIDTFAKSIVDAVGAGDALLAYSTLLMTAGASPAIASIIGSIAAGLECEQDGNFPITPKMIIHRLNEIEKLSNYEV
jgi:rfaE bifunctional protein kinase chain/domain